MTQSCRHFVFSLVHIKHRDKFRKPFCICNTNLSIVMPFDPWLQINIFKKQIEPAWLCTILSSIWPPTMFKACSSHIISKSITTTFVLIKFDFLTCSHIDTICNTRVFEFYCCMKSHRFCCKKSREFSTATTCMKEQQHACTTT